jgi:hypothetical protein
MVKTFVSLLSGHPLVNELVCVPVYSYAALTSTLAYTSGGA